ncbi:peptidoglycan DD-metalloendopeptidase family protein [Reyranella sp. CPCC 100927]|uniref:peptidoglycan DD-metalloendopeptidase family protein n=1 Tax=Reyranella sp. CPCC 100927 TaxID=2599616 RepID=UPI0011B7E090|nr:peptidoglycan DD-metalloendopeptidase family protein [Reyranella sp. CPCC 100927]TWS95844.1 peptidoglycan DD-metalloendopeptidase family protein [Reyranella sp. CPCC 100927]
MLDQPDSSETLATPSTPSDQRVSSAEPVQAASLPAEAGSKDTPAPPTLVALEPPARAIPAWLKLSAGLGGAALLAILGWVILNSHSLTTTADSPTADDQPVPSASAAPSPTEAPDTAGMPPDSGGAPAVARADTPQSDTAPTATPTDTPGPQTADATPPRSDDDDKPESMDRYETTVRIEKGDTLESVLRDMDFAPDEIRKAAAALKPVLKGARLPVGETITLQVQAPQESDGKPTLQALVIRPEARREITLERSAEGTFSARQRTFEVVPKLVRASGVVKGSLRGSADAAGIPPSVLAEMLRAFSWDVNLQYDVKGGDRFAVLIEQAYTTDGRLVSPGRVLWAQLTTGGGKNTYNVYRFKPARGAEFFYYGNGQSVVKSLLRTPMGLNRLSSGFGMRSHPIMGFTAMHTGVDFAAAYGTPILAAGAGTVVAAGPYGGYGNWVKIDHGGGIATGYAHMARYAPGIRPGARVHQGQVVGFVGSTGMSTGPHLHYELHQKGRPVNPLSARATQRAGLAGKDLERFRAVVNKTDRARDGAELIAAR